jgi:hypothetical protein
MTVFFPITAWIYHLETRKTMKARSLTFLVLSAGLSFPLSSMATDPISFRFTGHVTEIVDEDCSAPLLDPAVVSVDDPVSGIFTYDLDSTDIEPDDPGFGFYEDHSPPCPYSMTVNGLSFQNDPDNPDLYVKIWDDADTHLGIIDEFDVVGSPTSVPYGDLGLDDPEIAGTATALAVILIDSTSTVFSSDSLPSSLDLVDWDETPSLGLVYISGEVTGDPPCDFSIQIVFDMDSLDPCFDRETGLCSNGIDDDCDELIDGDDPDCTSTACSGSAEASTFEPSPVYGASDLVGHLACFMLPLGAVIGLRIWRGKR